MSTTDIVFGQQTITVPTSGLVAQPVKYAYDATSGLVSGLIDPITGIRSDYFSKPGTVPNGLSWLTDTLHGFDIYERGFVKRPTLFFDPTATTSMNRGTFAHPYNTQVALQAAIAGNMAGHVLGLKRGTTLQVTGTNGLNLNCYGSSSDPFRIVPYGDAEALPIITAKSAVTTWALCTGSTTVYKYTLATESDIWQNGTRVWKLNPTNGSTNNATGTTVNSEATAVTALDAKGDGWSVYYGGVLYFRPYSGENPNLGQCVIAVSDYAFLLQYSDVATSGYIEVAGLDVQHARTSAFSIAAAGVTTISAAGGIKVAGCRSGMAGVDTGSPGACDGLVIYGPSDAVKLTGLHVVGNEGYDVLNNAIEIAGTSGAIIEHNYGHDVGGNSIAELWASNINATVRYNYGNRSFTNGRRYQSFAMGGIWLANYYESGGTWNNEDTVGNNKNTGNVAVFNLIRNPQGRGFRISGGASHKVQHNTILIDGSSSHYTGLAANYNAQFISVGETTNGPAAGFVNISNNLCVAINIGGSVLRPSFIYCQHATAGIPNGDGNAYFQDAVNTSSNWGFFRAPGASKFSWSGAGSWLEFTALSASNMDANGKCTNGLTGGSLTSALLGFNTTTFTPLAANVPGIASLTGIGSRYKDGGPYSAASATIGAMLGT